MSQNEKNKRQFIENIINGKRKFFVHTTHKKACEEET